jgi:hypothetical protein
MRVNVLSPAAATRLINTIPGRSEDLDNPDPTRHPKLVTPAVLLMCSDDAPTGKVILAGNGRFSCAAVFNNEDVSFGPDVTYEDLLAQRDRLLDMSRAKEGWGWRRQQAQKADRRDSAAVRALARQSRSSPAPSGWPRTRPRRENVPRAFDRCAGRVT